MKRKIIGPEIIDKRVDYIEYKSMQFQVDILNRKLETEIVDGKGAITITLQYKLQEFMIKNLINLYINIGGQDKISTTTTFDGVEMSLYGGTQFIFYPSEKIVDKAKNRLENLR